MTTKTEITQKCYSITKDDDTIAFRVEINVVDAGTLPRPEIFVMNTIIDDDPTKDEFAYIANIQQLQEMPTSRYEVIKNGEDQYLTAAVSLQYDDLNTAVQGRQVLTTRLNDLVNEWNVYNDQFLVDSDVPRFYPTVDPGYEEQLKQDYADAVEAREDATTAALAAAADVDTSSTAVDAAQTYYDLVSKVERFCSNTINTTASWYTTYRSFVQSEETTEATDFREGTLEGTPTPNEQSINWFCGEMAAELSTASAAVTTAKGALEEAADSFIISAFNIK